MRTVISVIASLALSFSAFAADGAYSASNNGIIADRRPETDINCSGVEIKRERIKSRQLPDLIAGCNEAARIENSRSLAQSALDGDKSIVMDGDRVVVGEVPSVLEAGHGSLGMGYSGVRGVQQARDLQSLLGRPAPAGPVSPPVAPPGDEQQSAPTEQPEAPPKEQPAATESAPAATPATDAPRVEPDPMAQALDAKNRKIAEQNAELKKYREELGIEE